MAARPSPLIPDLGHRIVHDLPTVALMKEHGVTEIRIRDEDFRRFAELRVVDPLA